MGCRAITKASLNVHAGHDDYHCVDDTGFIQVMAKSATEAADLNLIGRKVAELSLTPAIIGQDGFLTTHLIESALLPERELVAEYLGKPDDIIDTPTPAQEMLYGPRRRRVPAIWDVDTPLLSGSVQNQDAYMQATAGQRPYFFDHIDRSPTPAWPMPPDRAQLPARRHRKARMPTTDRRHGQHDRAGRMRRRLPARDAQAQGRGGQPDHVPPLPRRPAGQGAARQEGRGGAGTHRPAPGDLPLMRGAPP
jgi:hypothetical protein